MTLHVIKYEWVIRVQGGNKVSYITPFPIKDELKQVLTRVSSEHRALHSQVSEVCLCCLHQFFFPFTRSARPHITVCVVILYPYIPLCIMYIRHATQEDWAACPVYVMNNDCLCIHMCACQRLSTNSTGHRSSWFHFWKIHVHLESTKWMLRGLRGLQTVLIQSLSLYLPSSLLFLEAEADTHGCVRACMCVR